MPGASADIYPGNFGGDGLASLFIVPHYYAYHPCGNSLYLGGLWSGWWLHRATGNGFTQPSESASAGSFPDGYPFGLQFFVGDFNGDGRDGVFMIGDSTIEIGSKQPTQFAKMSGWHLWSAGEGLLASPNDNRSVTTLFETGNGSSPSWGDTAVVGSFFRQSGSGLIAFGGSTHNSGYQLMNSPWTQPRLLMTSVDNGQTVTSVTYKALNTSGIHTPSTGSIYPILDINPSIPVVTQLQATATTTDAQAGVLRTAYTYSGLKFDQTGRGILGFGSMTSTQVETNLSTYKTFFQNFPFTGAAQSNQGKWANSVTSLASQTYGATVYTGPSSTVTCTTDGQPSCPTLQPGYRYFVYKKGGTQQTWDLDGSASQTSTTTSTYDTYGNELTTKTRSSDGHQTLITRQYLNDVTNWLLGRITQQTTQADTAAAP